MKTIKQIRENTELVFESEDQEERKLTALVRSGLLDQKKLPVLKRALSKENKVMTPAERNALLELLDALMAQVLSSDQVYRKIKQNVQNMNEEIAKAPTKMSDMPSIIVLKRKAVRMYPGGNPVGLYYSQQLDKYVSIPFGDNIPAMNEEKLHEISQALASRAYAARAARSDTADTDQDSDAQRNMAKKTLARIKTKYGAKASKAVRKQTNADRQAAYTQRLDQFKNQKSAFDKADAKYKAARGSGSVGKDTWNNLASGQPVHLAAANALGKAIFRRRNPTGPTAPTAPRRPKLNENQNPEQIDEALPLLALVGGTLLRGVAGALARRAVGRVAAGAVARTVGRGASRTLSRGLRGRGRGKGRGIDIDLDNGGGDNSNSNAGQSSSKPETPKTYSSTGGPSKLPVRTSNSFDADRGRHASRQMATQGNPYSQLREDAKKNEDDEEDRPSNRPRIRKNDVSLPVAVRSKLNIMTTNSFDADRHRHGQRMMATPPVREDVEVNLDGNKYNINSSVANKVISVYESLTPKNKKRMVEKMNESTESLNKVLSFVVRQ